MKAATWLEEFPGAITVCNEQGLILEMNEAAVSAYDEYGGRKLIGSNLLNCHPHPARDRLEGMLANQESNVYTIEGNGLRKLIYQTPWYRDGQYAGFVELSVDLPSEIPHLIRS